MRICQIVGAGDFTPVVFTRYDGALLIAADRGYLALTENGYTPDLLVGDFDSLGFVPDFPYIVRHPAEKDDTDMELAAQQGLAAGCDTFLLYGALGGRLDHSLANFQLLSRLSKTGCRAFIAGDGQSAGAVTDGTLSFLDNATGTISVFALGERAEGVTLLGLKYPLTDATLCCDDPVGVSNEFTGIASSVTVKHGTLTVLWTGTLDNIPFL